MRRSDSQTVTIISNSYQIIPNYRENLENCLGKLAQHRDHWLFIRSREHQNIWLCQVLYHQYLLHPDYFLITPIHQLHHYWDWVCEHHSISNTQQKTYKDSVMLSKMYFNTNSLRACARSSCYNTARKSSRLAFVPGIAFSPNHYWQDPRKMGIFLPRQISKSAYKCGPARWWQDPAGHAGLPSVPGDCQHCKQITLSFSCPTLTPYQSEQSKYLQHGRTVIWKIITVQ